jgi:hypothetical protein
VSERVEKTKPFDYVQEATKQLLTLSTAVVTITVSFLKDIVSNAPSDAQVALYIAWALFAASILGGVAVLYNLAGHVGGAANAESQGIEVFGIRFFSAIQLVAFFFAFVGVVYFGARAL